MVNGLRVKMQHPSARSVIAQAVKAKDPVVKSRGQYLEMILKL
jgi:hypothetical protein